MCRKYKTHTTEMNNKYTDIPVVSQFDQTQCLLCNHVFEEGDVCGASFNKSRRENADGNNFYTIVLCKECFYNMESGFGRSGKCAFCHSAINTMVCYKLSKEHNIIGCLSCFMDMKTHLFNFTYADGIDIQRHSPASSGHILRSHNYEVGRCVTPVNQSTNTTVCPGAPLRKKK